MQHGCSSKTHHPVNGRATGRCGSKSFRVVRVPDGGPQPGLKLPAVERHFFRLHRDNGIDRHEEVPGILDVDSELAGRSVGGKRQ